MLIKNVYVFQSVLECIGKVIVFVATVVSLTSCSRAQASRAAKTTGGKKQGKRGNNQSFSSVLRMWFT